MPKEGQWIIHASKYGFHCADFHATRYHSTDICRYFLYQTPPKYKESGENTDTISITLLRKVWFSLRRFSRKLRRIIWNFLTNFHSNWFEKWTTLVGIHVRPNVKYDFQLVDFHETQNVHQLAVKNPYIKFNENPPQTGLQLLSAFAKLRKVTIRPLDISDHTSLNYS
jgi:hypothetical protein